MKDWVATPGGFLRRPEGFDENGRNVLNDVGEFRLVEMCYPGGPRVVENSDEVQQAFDQAFFCVSSAFRGLTTPAKRIKLASALYELHEDVYSGKNNGEYAIKLSATLGKMLVKAMQERDPECAVNSCAASIKAALRSVAIALGKLPDKTGKPRKRKREVVAILEGRQIFESTGKRPTKAAIRAAMEVQGYVFRGNNAESKWRDMFGGARLHNLPER